MAHAQKPDLVFRRNGRVHSNRRGRQFSRLLAAEVCASTVVMLDTPCSKVVRRILATHSSRQFPLHFPSRASPCAITFQLESTQNTATIKRCSLPHRDKNRVGWDCPYPARRYYSRFLKLNLITRNSHRKYLRVRHVVTDCKQN
jgi:hypothetical protein